MSQFLTTFFNCCFPFIKEIVGDYNNVVGLPVAMLYQTMKHYNEIQTAYGTIQMKLADWQNAADQRKQLVDDWANLYQMDIIPFTYG